MTGIIIPECPVSVREDIHFRWNSITCSRHSRVFGICQFCTTGCSGSSSAIDLFHSHIFRIFTKTYVLRLLLLIIGLLLSCGYSDRMSVDEIVRDSARGSLVGSDSQDSGMWGFDSKSLAILPTRTAGYAGENNSVTSSVRSANSGNRRVQPSAKTSFLFIRNGKVIGRHNYQTFRTALKQFPSGMHSEKRYIHSLCQLLI